MVVKRVYIRWEFWECFKNGMYQTEKLDEKKLLKKAIKFTGNHIEYGNAMKEVVAKWKFTMLHHLTNSSINKRAFLGQCACSFKIGCPESIIRIAWKELTDEQRELADKVAQETIDEYLKKISEKENIGIYRNMGVQMLLQWDS